MEGEGVTMGVDPVFGVFLGVTTPTVGVFSPEGVSIRFGVYDSLRALSVVNRLPK